MRKYKTQILAMQNKSKQVERIATKIQESLQMWETIGGTPETKQEYEIKQFPKMYHPTDELIKIPVYTDGAKIVITVEKVDPYTNEEGELVESDSDGIESHPTIKAPLSN